MDQPYYLSNYSTHYPRIGPYYLIDLLSIFFKRLDKLIRSARVYFLILLR